MDERELMRRARLSGLDEEQVVSKHRSRSDLDRGKVPAHLVIFTEI